MTDDPPRVMTIEIEKKPPADASPAGADQIRRRLAEFNHRTSGGSDHEELHVFLRDASGQVRGGLLGWTVWAWFHVDSLWVDEDLRGQGWGSRLLLCGESEARNRGCEVCEVDTFSFQAKGFYEKAGYHCFGTLQGIGKGRIQRHYLTKNLINHPAADS